MSALSRRVLLAGMAAGVVVTGMLVSAPGSLATGRTAPVVPASDAAAVNLTQYVNPFVGTDDSNSPDPVGGGAGGSTYPGAVVPFGGIQFSPDTPTASPSGYRYSDTSIQSFSLTHFDGAGCSNNEDLPLLPVTGNLGSSPGTSWTSYSSPYTKSNESASPGYYKNRLDKYATNVELTATTRTGMGRLQFPAGNTSKLLINTSRSATGDRTGDIAINGGNVTGSVTAGNFCGSGRTYKIYFSIQFDKTPIGRGTWLGGTINAGSTSTSGTNSGGYVTFDTSASNTVQFKVGLSYVSVANATQNISTENAAWNFDTIKTNASNAWNDILNRVVVSGGSAQDLQKFYTALYHVVQSPNVSSDVNGQYMGFDNQVHTASHPVYQNYSGWDIYRSWAALVALIAPNEMTDIVKSMVLDGQQGGLLPKWSQQNQEDLVMTGDPGPIILASAHAFGVTNFDRAAALALMEKSSNGGTTQGRAIRGKQNEFVQQQYISADPSDSLEYSASDFAVAQFAKALGDTAKYNTHMQRAQWWRNVFNNESSYIHRRNADGSWPWPLDPGNPSGYTEGNASQYTWMVTYNFAGLINLMGGGKTAAQRLDHHFTELNGGLSRPYFYIGNEPEHGVPWAYNYTGQPWGAQKAVRRVMNESFTTGAGGLPGNDDLGATSAWYVWGALGMYPATPGADVLALHGPLFENATVALKDSKTLTITGGGAANGSPYVQGLSVNGTPTTKTFLSYSQIAPGGTLAYTMGTTPNTSWGNKTTDVPPSYNDGFTPPPAAPNLGTNLALGKPATGSAACASSESADKAVDGSMSSNSKWCSLASGTKTLDVDLQQTQTVGSFVIKHAGLGGERTDWNTGAYTISTSVDNTNWTTAASATNNRSSRTYYPIVARQARYVRLAITAPTNSDNQAARIYEFEVYGGSPNLALGKPATGSTPCASTEGPEKTVNGSYTGGNLDKWCSLVSGTKTLQIDLQASHPLSTIILRHAAAGGENASWNTRDFDLLTSTDGTTWAPVAQPRGNTAAATTHNVSVTARFVRLDVITPTSDGNAAARIYELEVYQAT